MALAEACRGWRRELGEFGAFLRVLVRVKAGDLVRAEEAQRRLTEGLQAEISSLADRGAQERVAALGIELRCRLAPRLTRVERRALDLLVIYDGNRQRVCALLGISRQRLSVIFAAVRAKAMAQG